MQADLNKKAFMAGMAIAKEKIIRFLLGRLAEYGAELLEDARFSAEYTSFTGNTLTSLAYGLYENGKLTDVVFISGVKPPVHAKVEKGQTLYLNFPHEGDARAVTGQVDIVDQWGTETSIKMLNDVCPKRGNGIIVTTGTEYSTFLENVKDLNVLSDTFLKARNEGLQDMRSWIDPNIPINRL